MKLATFRYSYFLASISIILLFSAFQGNEKSNKPTNFCFDKGEQIHYRVHYGFINAGESVLSVSERHYLLNNKVCYRVEVTGNTIGAFDKILRIRNVWGSYFDTSYLQPQKAFRYIQEGRYRKREETFFDYHKMVAKVMAENDTAKTVSIKNDIQDMVSGYYYLRLIDYNKLKKGDTIKVNGIFEDQVYHFKILYMGKHVVDTKYGKIPALLLKPVMPENKLFAGTNPISMYISDDLNRIPLKIKASLLVGSVELDIKDYKNLRHPLSVAETSR